MLLVPDIEVPRVLDDVWIAEGRLLLVQAESVLWEFWVGDVQDCEWGSH